MTQYKTLADASKYDPRYGAPGVEVWYAKRSVSRDLYDGIEFAREHYPESVPTLETLRKTHTLIGTLGVNGDDERNLHEVYPLMQGESWSPEGEALEMIRATDTGHTSMSVGDIIRVGGDLYFIDRLDLVKL